jgi:hypothetical protein
VVVLHHLALLVSDVLSNDPFVPEEHPLSELIELFALVGGGVDGLAQMGVADIAQQEHRPPGTPQLAKREIQLVC